MIKLSNKKYNLEPLAQRLEASRSASGDGQISLNSFSFDEIVAVLNSALEFTVQLPNWEKNRILTQALTESTRAGKITSESIVREAGTLVREYLRKPQERYVLATSLSIKPHFIKFAKVVFDGKVIIPTWGLPAFFAQGPINRILEQNEHSLPPSDFLTVRVSLTSRSTYEAFEQAIDAVDKLRGIWNFYLNDRTRQRTSFGMAAPVNSIRLGAVHRMFGSDGKPVGEPAYWYEPQFVLYQKSWDAKKDWRALKQWESTVRRKLRGQKKAVGLYSAFGRYARALDGLDLQDAFLKLWSLLEFLTGTLTSRYDVTIRRCLFFAKDREFGSIPKLVEV